MSATLETELDNNLIENLEEEQQNVEQEYQENAEYCGEEEYYYEEGAGEYIDESQLPKDFYELPTFLQQINKKNIKGGLASKATRFMDPNPVKHNNLSNDTLFLRVVSQLGQ